MRPNVLERARVATARANDLVADAVEARLTAADIRRASIQLRRKTATARLLRAQAPGTAGVRMAADRWTVGPLRSCE